MALPTEPIPAEGFKLVSGKRGPKNDGKEYRVQFRSGYCCKHTYKAEQLSWVHDGGPWDVVAVMDVNATQETATWTPKSGGY